MKKKSHDMLIADYVLHLVVGKDILTNSLAKFHTVKLYVRDKHDALNLYAEISLLYLINRLIFNKKFKNEIDTLGN